MTYPLNILIQIAYGLSKQFGSDCEVVIHDLAEESIENSIAYIVNGHLSEREKGGGPSKAVFTALELLKKNPDGLKDHLSYLTRTADGKIFKSSTMYIKDNTGNFRYLFAVNYNITDFLKGNGTLQVLTDMPYTTPKTSPEPIITNVSDLLDSLIEQSVKLIGKPPQNMNKDEKAAAIRFLNDAGAFLITKSGDKVAQYFAISKYTLYSYIDLKKSKQETG